MYIVYNVYVSDRRSSSSQYVGQEVPIYRCQTQGLLLQMLDRRSPSIDVGHWTGGLLLQMLDRRSSSTDVGQEVFVYRCWTEGLRLKMSDRRSSSQDVGQ